MEKIKIYTLEEQDAISVKVEKLVGSPAHIAYHLLSDLTKRPLWDPHYISCEVIDQVSEDDQIYYITCSVVNGDKPKDFVVLVSRRKPLKDNSTYQLANTTRSGTTFYCSNSTTVATEDTQRHTS